MVGDGEPPRVGGRWDMVRSAFFVGHSSNWPGVPRIGPKVTRLEDAGEPVRRLLLRVQKRQ